MSFATTDELQTFLGGTGLNVTRAQAMLDHASALIVLACGGLELTEVNGRQEEFAADDTVRTLFLSERPVNAVTQILVDGVLFTDYEWSRWGSVILNDGTTWSDGPIIVTYDSGFADDSAEWASIKGVCLEVATRAYTNERGDAATFNSAGIGEAIGWTPHLFLTDEEQHHLLHFQPVGVGMSEPMSTQNGFKEKVKSLSFPRKTGQAERKEIIEDRKVAETVTHWDGRQDATVLPDVIRRGTRMHNTGKKKGQVAEVRTMDRKERRDRYGEG